MHPEKSLWSRRQAAWSLVGALLLAGVQPLVAQAPKRLADVPIPPGATRDAAAEAAPEDADLPGWDEDPAVTTRTIRVYRTTQSVDDVARFYVQRLRAREGGYSDEMDPGQLDPGRATPVMVEYSFFDFENVPGEMGGRRVAQARRGAVTRARPAFRDGQWLEEASLWWGVREPDGSETTFSVGVRDVGLAPIPSADYRVATVIDVRQVTRKARDVFAHEQQEAFEEQQDRDVAARTATLTSRPPTERELGVPLYPGARFDARTSAGMSSDEELYYVYLVDDPPARVLAFYEQRTGKRGEGNAETGHLIVLRGVAPWPELGLTVQQNTMFGGTAKTVVTVRRVP